MGTATGDRMRVDGDTGGGPARRPGPAAGAGDVVATVRDPRSPLRLAPLLLLALAAVATDGMAAGVCPPRAGLPATQVEVFDGDPAELASLAPDDEDGGPAVYRVGYVYRQGRHVTIRCHYGGKTIDVPLVQPVATCRSTGDDRHPQVACE